MEGNVIILKETDFFWSYLNRYKKKIFFKKNSQQSEFFQLIISANKTLKLNDVNIVLFKLMGF